MVEESVQGSRSLLPWIAVVCLGVVIVIVAYQLAFVVVGDGSSYRAKTDDEPMALTTTTLPSRIAHIRPVLERALSQMRETDEFHLNIPWKCRRNDEPYVLPEWLVTPFDRRLSVFRVDDQGPISKSIHTLERLQGSPKNVLQIDDDVLLAPGFVERYRHLCINNTGTVYGFVGIEMDVRAKVYVNRHKYGPTDMVEGFGGIVFPRCVVARSELVPTMQSMILDKDCLKSDDVIISNALCALNVPREVAKFPRGPPSDEHPPYWLNDALFVEGDGNFARYTRVFETLKRHSLLYLPSRAKRGGRTHTEKDWQELLLR